MSKLKKEKILRSKALKKENEFLVRGGGVIYPERSEDWHNCVKARLNGPYNGKDLENAMEIIERLEKGELFEDVRKKISFIAWREPKIYFRIIATFSKRGPEFCRANCSEEMIESFESELKIIEKQNAQYKKNEIKRKKEAEEQRSR